LSKHPRWSRRRLSSITTMTFIRGPEKHLLIT
jgi:hypothetical protein